MSILCIIDGFINYELIIFTLKSYIELNFIKFQTNN